MKYYSTNNKNLRVSLKEAVMQGLAKDNGLFMPESIPKLAPDFFNRLHQRPFQEIAFEVAMNLVGDDIPSKELRRIVEHTIQFDALLVKVAENMFALELFHGPTLAFKDFGARFLSGLLGYFAAQQNEEITILVATSGDTGSAVANGFFNVPGTRVIVLYPSGKVSEVQEKQFTTLGGNVTAVEVEGTFDDCQRIVKQSFSDPDLNAKLTLTSANSINIARLIPQTFYYFGAVSQLSHTTDVVFSVPSGNFGNLTAGLLAKRMGLPVKHFIAATNINDVVPQFLKTGQFNPRPSVRTISNAMDVGNPSNFVRMVDLYENSSEKLSEVITGYSFTDDQTRAAMREVYNAKKYVMDPHGAVGFLGLKEFSRLNKFNSGIFLETAHPAKFGNVVADALGKIIEVPPALERFMGGEKSTLKMSSDFNDFKSFLLK